MKLGHLASSMSIIFLHLGYYMVFLNRFQDHREVVNQFESLRWAIYQPHTFVPALFIVGILALARLSRWPGIRQLWQDRRNRLFLLWFLVVFGLTQHYRVMKAVQPIHFAHGYDWIALFSLCAPLLLALLDRLLTIQPAWLGRLAVLVFLMVLLSDNIVWFGTFLGRHSTRSDISLSKDQKEILGWLDRSSRPPDIVVWDDAMMSYLVSTYTPVRGWVGHHLNTPLADERWLEVQRAFLQGAIVPAWENRHLFYVFDRDSDSKPPTDASEVFHNARYDIWECVPSRTSVSLGHDGLR